MKPLLLFSVVVCFCISCTRMLLNVYGVKWPPRLLTRQEISSRSSQLNIHGDQSFILDEKYFYALEKRDTLKPMFEKKCSPMISKYLQPLQALYFDEEGKLVSFHNNCYAGGFPLLRWNKDGQFDKFIPATRTPITDTVLNLGLLLHYIEPISQTVSSEKTKWTIVIFWCDFMMKQSKELIKIARKNLLLDNSHSVRILFVNTDNCFAEEKYSSQINKTN